MERWDVLSGFAPARARGLIESEWKEADSGRERKYYSLSSEGKKTLVTEREQWLKVHNYPLQIMENQTRFDLNNALENWRNELAVQPNLSADDRRELETHLRDAFAGLKSRGLSEEESFWLARRRVGQPQQLAEEFIKADPLPVWRERMFWMVLSLLAIRLWNVWNVIASSLTTPFFTRSVLPALKLGGRLPQWVSFYLPAWVENLSSYSIYVFLSEAMNVLLALTIVFLLVRGKNQKLQAILDFIFTSRTRFFVYLVALVTLDYVASGSIWNALMAKAQFHTPTNFFFVFWWNQAFGLFCLIALAVWLMPAQKRTARRRA